VLAPLVKEKVTEKPANLENNQSEAKNPYETQRKILTKNLKKTNF
jgi:hypothetical protein